MWIVILGRIGSFSSATEAELYEGMESGRAIGPFTSEQEAKASCQNSGSMVVRLHPPKE